MLRHSRPRSIGALNLPDGGNNIRRKCPGTALVLVTVGNRFGENFPACSRRAWEGGSIMSLALSIRPSIGHNYCRKPPDHNQQN